MQRLGIALIAAGLVITLFSWSIDTIWMKVIGIVVVILGYFLIYSEYSKESATV